MDKPVVVKVLENRQGSEHVKTIRLDSSIKAKPGQFVMLWIPCVGEKPFSLSNVGKSPEVTYDVKGKFTQALFELKKGDLIGIRGPYGNGWDLKGVKSVCAVTGGIGMAPLMPLIESGKIKTVIYGARNLSLLVFKKRVEKAKVKVIFTTDDGSFGKKCFACDMLEDVLRGGKYDIVLTCGPERLMRRVAEICVKNKVPCQASLERYMKCGIGICGACAIDPSGLRVCKDGPVFSGKGLSNSEFGRYTREKSGIRKPI